MQGRLGHVAENKAFGVFTGEAGTGKSTMIRRFASSLDGNRFQVIYIADSALTPRNFYWATLRELGQLPRFHRVDARMQLQKVLGDIVHSERRVPVFIIDEAHLLSHEMLEEVRFLLNVGMDSVSDLALILVGQSELREKLKLRINSAIWQRVDMRYHLQPLTSEECRDYIKAHLAYVQASREIFTEGAMGLIHGYADGIPRRINKLALSSLMAAASRKTALIDDHLVHLVIEREFEV
jgi:type II secretory pathway predicted ATPase ExeA